MKSLRKLFAASLILLTALPSALADQGLYVFRTEHTDGDGTDPITQKGGMASFTYRGKTDRTFAFWFKRDLGGDEESDDPARGINTSTTYFMGTWNSEEQQVEIGRSVLPADGEWHYYMLRIDDTGNPAFNGSSFNRHNYYLYRDGNTTPVDTGNFFYEGFNMQIYIGSQLRSPGNLEKRPTNYNFIIDDFATWEGWPADILDQFSDVSNFGMTKFELDHPDLISLLQFESDSDSLAYSADTRVDNGGSAARSNIANNYYDFGSTTKTFVDTSEGRINKIEVTVESEYGLNEVNPPVGNTVVDYDPTENTLVAFKAPEFVFLDRFGNELGSSDDDQTAFIDEAFYRAKLTGYTVNGAEPQSVPSDRVIQQPATENITVTWLWERQFAVILEMAVGTTEGLTSASGNASTEIGSENELGLGKKWATVNDSVSTFIDGIIYSENNIGVSASPIRFASTGVVLENITPGQFSNEPENFCATFDGGTGYLNGGNTGIDLQDTSFTVEFWSRMDPSDASSDQNIVSFGDATQGGNQLRVGFRNNAGGNDFFVANNSSGTEVDDAEYIDNDWHHWAVVYDKPNTNIYIYRDGELIRGPVSRDFIFSTNGNADFLAIGARATATGGSSYQNQFNGSVDNIRVWSTTRTESEVQTSMDQMTAYGSQTGLELELTFDTPSLTALTSTEGSNLTFNYQDADNLFPDPSIADDDKLSILFNEFGRDIFATPNPRISVEEIGINDWVRIQWQWESQFRIQVGVNDPLFVDLPFIESGTEVKRGAETGEYWISKFAPLRIGTQYRTDDRCYTLTAIQGQSYLFPVITMDTVQDGVFDGAVTREFSFPVTVGPGDLTFVFDRTIFRAEVPLGEGLDVSTDLTVDAESQLVPNLCEGGALHLSNGQPSVVFANVDLEEIQSGGTAGNTQIQWDAVGKKLFPLQPGTYRVEWPDANDPNKSHLIELVADFPTETYDLYYERENDDGSRQISSAAYVYETTLPSVSDRFPGSPTTHYNHIYSTDLASQPPVALDPNPSDRWTFKEMTYSTGSVIVNDQDNSFSANSPGKSVLLYNYAVQPSDVSVGDDSREAYAVRIVNTTSMADSANSRPEADLSSGERMAFDAYEESGIYARPAGIGSNFSGALPNQTWEFWAKLDPSVSDETQDRLVFEIEQESNGETLMVGFHGADHPTAPNALFTNFALSKGTEAEGDLSALGFTGTPALAPDPYYSLFLVFNEGGEGEVGSVKYSELGAGQAVTNFIANFDVNFAFGGGTIADDHGFSFSFAPDLGFEAFGADGAGTGLTIQFDPSGYSSDGTGVVHLLYNNTLLATTDPVDFLKPQFDQQVGPVMVPLSIILAEGGALTLTLDGTTIFDQIPTPFTEGTDWDLAFGGSSKDDALLGAIDDEFEIYFNVPDSPEAVDALALDDHYIDYSWHHYALVISPGLLKTYIDGRLAGTSAITSTFTNFSSNNNLTIGYSRSAEGLWLNGSIDNFGRWTKALSTDEVRDAFFNERADASSGVDWWIAHFDSVSPTNSANLLMARANGSTLPLYLVDSENDSVLPDATSALSPQSADFFPEVATRIRSKYDTAGFGSGFLTNTISNYNAGLYDRSADVGTWGPIFPVNWSGLYANSAVELASIYYENPFYITPFSTDTLHPNVAWPYTILTYNDVQFPTVGEHKDKKIYVSSRLGTEGVDGNGDDQEVYDPAIYDSLSIYNQPVPLSPGYNPNEEHALIYPSIKAFLTGDNSFDLGQDSVFALQRNLNLWGTTDSDTTTTDNQASDFSSEPWVLTQYQNKLTGEWFMSAYHVEGSRTGSGSLFPNLDPVTNTSTDSFGQPVPQPTDPTYDFEYPAFAGNLHLPPYPMALVIGATLFDDDTYGNLTVDSQKQRSLWFDINDIGWVVSGDGRYYYRHHYPLRNDFWYDLDDNGVNDAPLGEAIPFYTDSAQTAPTPAKFNTFWKNDYPTLKRGETMTHVGGEHAAENPGADGLPGVVGWAAGQVVYDNARPSMDFQSVSDLDNYTARLVRPLDRIEVDFAQSDIPDISPNLTPANSEAIQVIAERWHFKALTGSLQKRLYYDTLNQKLVFRGRLNDLESGNPDLTATPVSLFALEPNYMTKSEYDGIFTALEITTSSDLGAAITSIFLQSQNPHQVLEANSDPSNTTLPVYLAGTQQVSDQAATSRFVPHITENNDGSIPVLNSIIGAPIYDHLQSLGSGSALIPNPDLLNEVNVNGGPFYVTLAENNHPDAGGAISIHVIEISPERFRGAIKIIEAANVFDEKINLQHNGDFGGNTEDLYYEWWYRPVDSLINVGLPVDDAEWQPFAKGMGLHKIEFNGNPAALLSDNLFYVRYGHSEDFEAQSVALDAVTEDQWRLVDLNDNSDSYDKGISLTAAHILDPDAILTLVGAADGATLSFDNLLRSSLPSSVRSAADSHTPGAAVDQATQDLLLDGLNYVISEGGPFYEESAYDTSGITISQESEDLIDSAGIATIQASLLNRLLLSDALPSAIAPYVGDQRSPFQWAGASNSPQLQADGSYNFIPQLVMGWVKRVLDRVNPYEARYSDFYNNESPATYSSQLQIAGGPFIGKVALNADKDVIENVGLIELYETVLARAKELSIDLGTSSVGINQAILLASTRLSFLYELLGKEAYSDAQNPTITVTSDNGLSSVAPYVHAFTNQEASLLHEELALLRGTDFVKAYPSYNRLFWNYVKGEGEAAYNANYNIYDINEDGFINEFDAAKLYPQGHGDSWGHLVSANKMHYDLLRNNVFDWEARAELYSLLDNVIEADYLDEKTFSRIAAAKARAGNEIVAGTYRLAYVEDPNAQWQGYTDTANPARAWGVSEWGKRAGQGAYFDWVVGNLLVPEDADEADPASGGSPSEKENLHQIDRRTNLSELGEIAGALVAAQQTLDNANLGYNPIGLDRDALVFDIDPLLYSGDNSERQTHFEQVYAKALTAGENALAALDYASQSERDLRKIADDTRSIQFQALRQDIDYRNRLIKIFGRPYSGNIGPGELYAEGYDGPDTLLYNYVDRLNTSDYLPTTDDRFTTRVDTNFVDWPSDYSDLDWDPNWANIGDDVEDIFDRYYLTEDFDDLVLEKDITVTAPVVESSDYSFQVPDDNSDGVPDWGSRSSYGELQVILGEMIAEQIALQRSVRDYAAYIEQMEILSERLKQELRAHEKREQVRSDSGYTLIALNVTAGIAGMIEAFSQWGWDFAWQTSIISAEFLPKVVGFSVDVSSAGRGALFTIGTTFRSALFLKWTIAQLTRIGAEAASELVTAQAESDEVVIDEFREMQIIVAEVGNKVTEEEGKRLAISQHIQRLEQLGNKYQTKLAEGFRLLKEREAYNVAIAGDVQRNRYSDMVYRLARNEAMTKYQDAFDHALKYAWLTAKAYDYETSLDPTAPAAATTVLQELVKTRTLGLWQNGQPRIGKGGLAEQLAQLKANFEVLEGQLGINNPQIETGKISLRHEKFRVKSGNAQSNERWQTLLNSSTVRHSNLWDLPEFRQYCRPFASPEDGDQPGLVIDFTTMIESGYNLFGRELGANDQAYSSANFATKIRSTGVWFEGYAEAGLATAPRVYLVPVGSDTLKLANSLLPQSRTWNVVEQSIPAPFVINENNLANIDYIPSQDSSNGSFGEIRRFGDFRAYPGNGDGAIDNSQLATDSRLIGRSIANSRWLLIIPGASLHSDANYGLDQFVENISDIQLVFETYSHQGK